MDRTARLWHLEYTFPLRVYAGHEKDVDVVRFHPNCNYLATAGADKTVRLWTHADAKMVRRFFCSRMRISLTQQGYPESCVLSPYCVAPYDEHGS